MCVCVCVHVSHGQCLAWLSKRERMCVCVCVCQVLRWVSSVDMLQVLSGLNVQSSYSERDVPWRSVHVSCPVDVVHFLDQVFQLQLKESNITWSLEELKVQVSRMRVHMTYTGTWHTLARANCKDWYS